jgi:hypothetical protein
VGKTPESLEQSRAIREILKDRWGIIPSSIMKADWSIGAIDLSMSYQDQRERSKYGADSPFSLSGVGARHGALSRMPQNIVRWATKFFTPEKLPDDTQGYFGNHLPTVIDPFCGHNSRFESVWRCNRNYVGWDISHNFMEMNRKVKGILEEENKNALIPNQSRIELVEGDSRDINYDSQFDFCITSPPFYDLEDYGDELEQLGRAKLYTDFLYSLGRVIENCYRALKPNAFIAWEVNDFRREGVFHAFHVDCMRLFERAGFILWDIIIIDYGSGFLQSFAQDIAAYHIVSKEHSYLVVARKIPKRVKREKVREQLLEQVKEHEPKTTSAYQQELFDDELLDI